MEKEKSGNLLTGNLWKQILFFAVPIICTSVLEQLFNACDVAVVGQFVGSEALAAVGANGSVINLIINTFVGLSIGSNVIIAHFIGLNKKEHIKKAVDTSLILSVVLGLLITLLGVPFAPNILELMSTPHNILSLASLYLRIYLCGAPFILLYNFESAILRSRGETRIPLMALAAGGLINVVLNLVFVLGLGRSVDGVATATVISNIISSMSLMIYLIRDQSFTHLEIRHMTFDFTIMKSICKVGVPAALQGAFFSISNVVVQSSINTLGPTTIAASADALNFETIAYYLITGYSQAVMTFTSQNYGAGNLKRCRQVMRIAWVEAAITSVLFSVIILTNARLFASIFSSDPKVISVATVRMFWLLAFEVLNLTIEILSGAMRGYGISLPPALITVFGICVLRIVWLATGAKMVGGFAGILMCYPISWIITDVMLMFAYIMVRRKAEDVIPA